MPVSGGQPIEIPFPYRAAAVLDYVRQRCALLVSGWGPSDTPAADSPSLWLLTVPSWTTQRVGNLRAGVAAVSPDGERLALNHGPEGRRIGVARLDGSDLREVLEVPYWGPQSLEWSSDGKRLRFMAAGPASREQEPWIWETPITGGPPRPLFPGAGGEWTSDGRYFLFMRGQEGRANMGIRYDLYAVRERAWPPWSRPRPVQITAGPLSF